MWNYYNHKIHSRSWSRMYSHTAKSMQNHHRNNCRRGLSNWEERRMYYKIRYQIRNTLWRNVRVKHESYIFVFKFLSHIQINKWCKWCNCNVTKLPPEYVGVVKLSPRAKTSIFLEAISTFLRSFFYCAVFSPERIF